MRSIAMESVLALWFLLVAAYFFAPLPPAIGTALYGVFLVMGAAALALRVLRARESPNDTVPVPSDPAPRKKGRHRG